MKTRLLVCDFDGTLTTRDTLTEFIRYAAGTPRLLAGLLLYAPLIVLMKLHLADNGRTKQRLFAHFFKGMALSDFNRLCDGFGQARRGLLRHEGKALVAGAVARGERVAVVSASIDNWVIPFFYDSNAGYADSGHTVEVIGTRIEVVGGRLTGRFLTPNCYGAEKVRRLQEAVPGLAASRTHYYIAAYGDSRGDREMLGYADEGHLVGNAGVGGEILRFGIVGTAATLLQYAIYFALIQLTGNDMPPARQHVWSTAAMTVGYGVSFVFNFFASTRFTFRVKASARRGAGFLLSHAVNYCLQMLTLNLFLWLGVPRAWAPVPMFCVCVPVNFVLVRFFLKR